MLGALTNALVPPIVLLMTIGLRPSGPVPTGFRPDPRWVAKGLAMLTVFMDSGGGGGSWHLARSGGFALGRPAPQAEWLLANRGEMAR